MTVSITDLFAADHRACDQHLPDLESAAQGRRWDAAARLFASLDAAVRRHLDAEEQVLFPAFEKATGQRGGPTMMMRMEHEQMRMTLAALTDAVRGSDQRRCLDLCDTLMVLVQQHNMKEEQILYPMCDEMLGGDAALHQRLAAALPSR